MHKKRPQSESARVLVVFFTLIRITVICIFWCKWKRTATTLNVGADGVISLLFFASFPDLIHCTNEMNVNIPQLADSLFERTTNTSWVVVFKSLITTHHLMVYGNEVRPRRHSLHFSAF